MPRGSRAVATSRSAAASRSTSARKASPASARLGRRTTSAKTGQGAAGGRPSDRQFATGGPTARSRQQLYQEAKARDVKGRSSMTKAELARALGG
jgi:hypothetical protein